MASKELIKLLKANNPQAISDLYDKYAGALYGIILRMVKSQPKAEEILEQTFLKALKDLDLYRHGTSFFTWMCSIARSLASKDLPPAALKNSIVEVPFLESQHMSQDYQAFTRNMDNESKEVLNHVYLRGLSLVATSELLGISVEQVKVQFKVAFDSLRSKFQLHGKMLFNVSIIILLIHL